MAESAVSFAVEKLRELLIQEAVFLYGVRHQVEWVKTELERMQCFLEDADAKQKKGDKRVKNWVKEITDVAYRAEDVIDTFMLRVQRRRRQRGLVGFTKRYTSTLAYQMIARHKVGLEIASIKIKVGEISASRATYGIANIGETGGNDREDAIIRDRRRISPDLGNEILLGFNTHCEMLVSQLLDTDNMRRCVISIVGMGGLGKTSLAKKVYNDPQIKANFSTRVWITVSNDFKLPDLIKSITRKATGTKIEDLEKMEDDEVKVKLNNFLKETKHLIVIDDVWTKDDWQMISVALPDVMNVLLTTRFEEVAKSADPLTLPFFLPFLTPDESLKLFTRIVFPSSIVPPGLEELVGRMAGRCKGLPLALAVLGGTMSTKPRTPDAWTRFENSMNRDSTREGDHCIEILALSYYNLPDHYHRSCFLYISLFPEDSEIFASELARLWIAEGFIPQKGEEMMEDTAKDYLEEFVQRSMLQVVRRWPDGSVKTCRIHDRIREMCLIEAKHDRFLGIISGGTRRLALENLTNDDYNRSYLPSNLRSLFIHSSLGNEGPLRLLHGLKLLRVLYLSGLYCIKSFPKEIELMGHLRFLKVSCDLLLPSSISKLHNLQTLDIVGHPRFSNWPKELGELPMLTHLFCLRGTHPFPSFTTTTNLQTLKWVTADQQWVEESLPRLTSLRRLSIFLTAGAVLTFDSVVKLRSLDSLSINCDGELPKGTVVTALAHNHHLRELSISTILMSQPISLPESNRFPVNLAKLTLKGSKLEDDPMPVLEKLPNLVYLKLSSAYQGIDLVCTKSGFSRLQELKLKNLRGVKDWTVEVGAFPALTYLSIDTLENLAMLPEALRHVTSIMKLVVVNSLLGRLTKDVGEDWYKIQHVPTIIIKEK